MTITGKGNYKGSVSKTYTINAKSISGAVITLATSSYTYDGYAKKPSVTVKVDSKNLIMMNDGAMEYSKFMDMMKEREWRADVGASVLLLPKELVTNVYRERIGYDNLKVYGNSILMAEDNMKLADMAKFLKVSYDMLVNRLYDLDLLEKHNVSEFISLAFGFEDNAI